MLTLLASFAAIGRCFRKAPSATTRAGADVAITSQVVALPAAEPAPAVAPAAALAAAAAAAAMETAVAPGAVSAFAAADAETECAAEDRAQAAEAPVAMASHEAEENILGQLGQLTISPPTAAAGEEEDRGDAAND